MRRVSDMPDETYNGWNNYPTWCINLWLQNDKALYEMALKAVESHATDAHERGTALHSIIDEPIWSLHPRLQEEPSFIADLFGWAMQHINWWEIAEAWHEDTHNH